MEQQSDRFERTSGEWIVSILFFIIALSLFALLYPHHEFLRGDKMRLYPLCAALAGFVMSFYRAFIRPYAYRFQPDGTLLLKSVFLSKALPIAQLESVTITQVESRSGPKDIYTVLLKGGDPIELPALGLMRQLVERLSALNPEMEVLDKRPETARID